MRRTARSKYPPAKPEALWLLAPQKGPERSPQPTVLLLSAARLWYQGTTSVIPKLQPKASGIQPLRKTSSLLPSHVKSTITTPENVKLLLPPRQSPRVLPV